MKKLVVIVILFALSRFVWSQDAQPTLSTEELYAWSAIAYFPQEIDFTLIPKLRESTVSLLTLTITYRGAEEIAIEIDPASIINTDTGSIFRYQWDIPRNNPPPLFSRIRYSWDILTASGESYIITDDLDFVDGRVTWTQSNDLQSQVNIFYAQNQLDPDAIRDGIRATYDLLFARTTDKPIYTLLVYPADVPPACNLNDDDEPIIRVRRDEEFVEVNCDVTLANRIYEMDNYIVFNQTSVDAIQQTIIDLLVDTYYTEQWGSVSVPDWFLRGLQLFYDPRPKLAALNLAQQQARAGNLLSLSQLATHPNDDNRQMLWEAQSIGLILYLADTLGVEGLSDFANSIQDDETFAEAYESYTDQSLDLLILSWQDWLFRASTVQDYEYNPYLPETPTPTVTPTATHTPTATFTPATTPDITNTPRPTITPIPPTRTITPLPAQSFSVQPTDVPPTPVPQESGSQSALDADFITRAGIGGAVILGLLMILYLVLRKR